MPTAIKIKSTATIKYGNENIVILNCYENSLEFHQRTTFQTCGEALCYSTYANLPNNLLYLSELAKLS